MKRYIRLCFLASLILIVPLMLWSLGHAQQAETAKATLVLKKGDHIALLGNALAERLQHDGWLETYLYNRFPDQELVIRNLGFSGDELTKQTRHNKFGSYDEWLNRTKTEVVLAFFGYNESYAGQAGLAKFTTDLNKFVDNMKKPHGGANEPRVVLVSPIAHENLHDPNLPDGIENNKRLEIYTAAMQKVAAARNVPFVDLFHPTYKAFSAAWTRKVNTYKPFTINGVHLNSAGNEMVSDIIDRQLFGDQKPADKGKLEKIREAVIDKNVTWMNRYRTLDGFNIYGGRSTLDYANGSKNERVTNYDVLWREMEILDAMTANRDKRCWAVAQGGDMVVDDSNTPPFVDIQSNTQAKLYLDPEEAIKKMTVGTNLKVELFASEKEFPDLTNPVQMNFDNKGRLWVATWPSYPHYKPKDEMKDKLLVFEDTKGAGKADKMTVFADHLNCPTGFEFYNGGVMLAQAPYLQFLKDTNGDGKADFRERLVSTLDSADSHHSANSFTIGPDGALYWQEGTFCYSSVETPWGPTVRTGGKEGAGAYRFEPRTFKFEVYTDVDYANPHGHVFDRWGQDILVDGTGAIPYDVALVSGQSEGDFRHKRNQLPVYKTPSRPCPAIEFLSSRMFPAEYQENLLVPNVIGFQGIYRVKVENKDAALVGTQLEPILRSSDPNFRPVDLKIGPDGALYFIDWSNALIGHMQHHLRDPNRDHTHGRIYRVSYNGGPVLQQPKIAGEPIEKLLDLLKEPEDRVRGHARVELASRDTKEVLAATDKWIEKLDRKDPQYEHNMMEALWLYQTHNVVNEPLLKRMLRADEFHARAASTRVVEYWRDRLADPLALLHGSVNDPNPRVRLEGLRALSFFRGEAPIALAMEAMSYPTDKQINFVFNETLSTLERRLTTRTKIDRNNIAQSLLRLLDAGQLDSERKAALIETIVRNGTANELNTIWARTLDDSSYPPSLRSQTMRWLAEAATIRRVQPILEPEQVHQLIAKADAALLPDALRLAAAWKSTEAAGDFQRISQDGKAPIQARYAALDGLAALNDAASAKLIDQLAREPNPLAVRYHAATVMASLDLDAAAQVAAAALARPDPDADPEELIQTFLNRKNGPEKLGAALKKMTLSQDTAKRLLRSMFLAGHSEPPLIGIVSKFAGLDAAPHRATAAEIQELVAEVSAKGNAVRGEEIFHRADLGCIKCHSINKAGGNIGPDLGPVGAASPLDYVVTSILDPNASVKEEYLTKMVTTSAGQIFAGIVVDRSKSMLALKDATGKIIRIPASDIEEELPGKTLMPEGVTRLLTHAELVDLARFVSDLGKPGPFAAPTATTIQRFKRLRFVTTALADVRPGIEDIRALLITDSTAWEPMFAHVDGKLPIADVKRKDQPPVAFLQGEIQVTQAGPVQIRLDSSIPATVWLDDHPVETKGQVDLSAGRHTVTFRLDTANTAPTDWVRVELTRAPDSPARYEIVNMNE